MAPRAVLPNQAGSDRQIELRTGMGCPSGVPGVLGNPRAEDLANLLASDLTFWSDATSSMISQSILFRPNAKAVDKAPKQMLLILRGIPPLSCATKCKASA